VSFRKPSAIADGNALAPERQYLIDDRSRLFPATASASVE
jgi:hypothetical protein